MNNILLVSHCILNTASKVVLYDKKEIEAEEDLRRKFVGEALRKGVQFIQLPCPEFTLYGSRRWGHVSTQFDNPFFRDHCSKQLDPVILQLKEYVAHKDRFHVIGILGIDGSPSCGVDRTCFGQWGGSFGERTDLKETLDSVKCAAGSGVLIDVLKKRLETEGLTREVPVVGLFAAEPEKCMALLENL
ncbi:MAG TPA: hypothetical protein H9909_01830 [Candidatus Mediterraneibacter norfolkensis]|nr:hypothetical protein [Candidatus Mediterraneibacter norfolkensis]